MKNQVKIRLDVSRESLFSSKDNNKKLKCRLLQFLFGALRVKFQVASTCYPQKKVNP